MIDFSNLPVLPSPARSQRENDRLRRERQQANAIKSKGRKKHSVNRERSREDAAKARKAKQAIVKRLTKIHAYTDAVRAYWRGEREDHPVLGDLS